MKQKLAIDLGDGAGERIMFTNMFVITEWERLENRSVKDLVDRPRYSDLCCWAHTLVTLAGDKAPSNWREWVKQHPNMTITSVDEVEPVNENPMQAAPTAAS